MIRSQSAGSESTNGAHLVPTCVVDEHVDPAELRVHLRDHGRHRLARRDVGGDAHAVDRLRGLLGRVLVDVGDHHRGALGGELLRDAAADALPGPGDDRDLGRPAFPSCDPLQGADSRPSFCGEMTSVSGARRGRRSPACASPRTRAPPPCLRGDRVEVERRHREVGQPGLVVGVGVERLLEEPDRRRALLGDLAAHAFASAQQLVGRDDLVHQAPALGGRRVVEAAQVPHLARPLLADDAGEVGRAEARVERADPRPGLPEAGGLGGDREVAQHVQHVPAADRDPVDRRDHRLRDVADQPVQVADLEHAALGGAVVAGLGALLDVAAGAERLVARAGEDHRLHAVVGPRGAERPDQLLDRAAAERVVPLRPVDGDHRGGALDGVVHVLVVGHDHHHDTVAAELFGERGYAAVSLDDVALDRLVDTVMMLVGLGPRLVS